MRITNHANLPEAIVEAIRRDPYDAGPCDISLTRLIGPPQIRILERRHDEAIEEDAADRIWALVGQIGHGILERAENTAIAERRLFADVAGWRISGQLDRLVVLPDGRLQDYKFTSVWACQDGPKEEWVAQLNALRWLLHANGYPPTRTLEIVAILRDWSRGKARAGGGYPRHQVRVLPVGLWTLEEAESYLIGRVRLHQAAEAAAAEGRPLPECTPEERWARPDTYAVRKPGRKTALRVFERAAEAHALAAATPDGYVEARPGEAVRCAGYCAVAPFCAQRQAELADTQASEAA
ncbi:hypothetical protein [Thiococcus pfennigii]|uniref:hypothetical protein n=1 Tax=Thiococcus pfennigii TaxID=1057 RepID=UPI001904CD3B|nr:hypothetical protein [Thiococcus pfennigii]MBK1733636.1 hypothetical protein [Thiococcus pfennigii]